MLTIPIPTNERLRDFERRLADELHRYQRVTGKQPTHAMLGLKERHQHAALIHAMQARGELINDPKLYQNKAHWFMGVRLIDSIEDSLLVAGYDPGHSAH